MDAEIWHLIFFILMLLFLAGGGFAKGWEECEKHYGLKNKPRCSCCGKRKD